MPGTAVATRKARVALLSVASNSLLIALKLAVGLLIGSVSVLCEAIHSGMDLLAALLAFLAVRKAHEPADEEHPYGHGKFENISGTVEALLIFVAAGWIIYEAVRKLSHPQHISEAALGFGAMAFSAVLNILVSEVLFRVGRETDSVALQADAWHLRTDVWTSGGVAAALLAIVVGRRFAPDLHLGWLDPLAALAVAVLIIRAAGQLTLDAVRDLLDARLPHTEEQWIREHLAGLKPTIAGFHRLRTRKSGAVRFIDMHVLVDEDMHVWKAHKIADEITAAIEERLPRSSVTVHVEPCAAKCDEDCERGCLLTPAERDRVRLRHPHG
jgi:cation diffusion facilitator family transporter